MISTSRGKILSAIDHGTIWQLLYQIDGDGLGVVNFDHRPFAHFYEGATDRDFFKDYAFGRGCEYISQRLKGRRISVEGDRFNEVVRLEDD
ncbi:hypothetical protein MYX77_00980 [Acidobacteriia bacterium AH_259_A11_L15]|nr:hypothetical protein [Acidobacteriia bacterium AH_259_A11_L15]